MPPRTTWSDFFFDSPFVSTCLLQVTIFSNPQKQR
ncbi:unnamed protein product [Brassica oleracea]